MFESSEEEADRPQTSRRAHNTAPRSSTSKPDNTHSNTPPATPSSKKRKHRVNPIAPNKYSTYDLFGTDSEDEESEKRVNNNGDYSMHSYFIMLF